MVRKDLAVSVAFAIFLKALYFSQALLLNYTTGTGDYTASFDGYIHTLKKNDAFWYERIATQGYPVIDERSELGYHDGAEYRQSEWAFFPLYPLLTASLAHVPGMSIDLAFLVISYFFSLAAFLLFYLFILGFSGERKLALITTLLLMAFPFHYYFTVFYTEAIFLALTVGSFICILKGRYGICSVMLAALALLRPNGIVIVVPLYYFMLEKEGLATGLRLQWKDILRTENMVRTAWFLTAPLAFLAYGYYQYRMTGEFFAFSIAQEGWYREPRFPLLSLFREGNLANQFDSVYTIGFMLFAIFIWKRLPVSLNLIIWLGILLPLASGTVQSMPRFISVIFPFMMIMGSVLTSSNNKLVTLTLLVLLQLVSYYFWLIDHPLSY